MSQDAAGESRHAETVVAGAPALDRRKFRHIGRWIAGAVGLVVALLGVIFALQVGTDPVGESRANPLVGRPAPTFDLPTLTGDRVRSAELRGKTVIVNFWNSWCIPCRQEHPELVAFYKQHANEPDFAMIGIVRDDTRDAIRRYVAREGVPYLVAFDPDGTASTDFGTRGQPETFAISPDGLVVAFQYGPSTVGLLEHFLALARGQG